MRTTTHRVTPDLNAADRRAARRARVLARMADEPRRVPVDTTIDDVQVGDYVEVIPSQGGVRGCRVVATITGITESWESWGESRGRGRARRPVASRILTFAHGPAVDVPADFRVTVHRAP